MKRLAPLAVTWLPAAVVAALSLRFCTDVPYADVWDWLDRHYPLTSHAGVLTRYWWPFNDSRVLVPLLLDRMLVGPTHMDMAIRAVLKLPVALGTALLLLRLVRRTFPGPRRAGVEVAMVAAAFPLASWPMWVDPRLFAGHASVLLVVAAVSSATGVASSRAFWTAVALGCTASLTYIHGSLVWPALFAGLWLAGQGTRAAWPVAVALAALLEITRAVDASRLGAGVTTVTLPVASWLDMARAAFGILGAPVAYGRTDVATAWAVAAGVTGLAVALAMGATALRERDLGRRALPWMMLIAWALTNVAAMALGRARFGMGVVFTERYVPVTALFWAALVAVVSLRARRSDASPGRRVRSAALAASGVALALSWTIASWDAVAGTRLTGLPAQLSVGRECLSTWPDVDDECLRLLFPDAGRARAILTHLAPMDPSFLRPSGRTPIPVRVRRVAPPLAWSKAHVESGVPGGTLVDALDVAGWAVGPVVHQHPPSALSWRIVVPDVPRPTLDTGVRVNTPPWPQRGLSDGVLFEVRVEEGSGSAAAWRRVVPPAEGGEGFAPVSVDLSRWRGRTVRLSLVTLAGDSPQATNAFDWAVWLYPALGAGL